jgi:helicase SWR1
VLEYFNLEPSNSLHAAVARCHLNASQALHDKLTQELGPEPADKPLTVRTAKGWAAYLKRQRYVASQRKIDRITAINARRTVQEPVYPAELVDSTRIAPLSDVTQAVQNMVKGDPQRAAMMSDVIKRFAFATPNAKARGIDDLFLPASLRETEREEEEDLFEPFHLASTKLAIAFPDLSLIQYDCGKLQVLADLLRQFQANGQRVLIFTQMTKVLDILEIFLSWLGHRYLRLDGSTKVEDRQIITERFNRDERIMAFISSTRAGGLGINLTGASCVVFYDSDWNP